MLCFLLKSTSSSDDALSREPPCHHLLNPGDLTGGGRGTLFPGTSRPPGSRCDAVTCFGHGSAKEIGASSCAPCPSERTHARRRGSVQPGLWSEGNAEQTPIKPRRASSVSVKGSLCRVPEVWGVLLRWHAVATKPVLTVGYGVKHRAHGALGIPCVCGRDSEPRTSGSLRKEASG